MQQNEFFEYYSNHQGFRQEKQEFYFLNEFVWEDEAYNSSIAGALRYNADIHKQPLLNLDHCQFSSDQLFS